MKRAWIVKKGLKFALFAVLFFAVFGFVLTSLWNWLMPTLFGLHTVSFWQAVGLLILSKIFFGGFHGRRGGHMFWKHRMMERWEQMTPEEREKCRQEMGARCGSFGGAMTEPKAQ